MIKKLKQRLIVASMSSLFLVLLIILSIVGILNYTKIINNADTTLRILKENNGVFPKEEFPHQKEPMNNMSPELPYESRYFSVTFNSEDEVIENDTRSIVAVDSYRSLVIAQEVYNSKKKSGFYQNYRYLSFTNEEKTKIIFLDVSRDLINFKDFIFTSILVSIFGLVAVFLVLMVIANKVVKPFIENDNKQKQFITDASHELKTPLTIIEADLSVLEMEGQGNEWIDDIYHQTNRLTNLTNDLVLLSKMEENKESEKIEFPLSDVLTEICNSFKAIAIRENKHFETKIKDRIPITANQQEIEKVIHILLDNALKYGDDKGWILVKLKDNNKRIELEISNSVEYIDEEELHHFFDRFYRTDKSRNYKKSGYGIGLSIAEAIIKKHKGKIEAKKENDKSLTIKISLPK